MLSKEIMRAGLVLKYMILIILPKFLVQSQTYAMSSYSFIFWGKALLGNWTTELIPPSLEMYDRTQLGR